MAGLHYGSLLQHNKEGLVKLCGNVQGSKPRILETNRLSIDAVPRLVSLETFSYGKRAFATNLAFIFLMIIFSLFLALIGPVDRIWLIILLSLEILVLLLLGISPFLTDHELIDRSLILRQGWYFRSSIDLDEIQNIELDPRGPSRTGVYFKVFESSVYIIAERNQVIILKLRSPKRFGLILGKKADCVVFDVLDAKRLIRKMEEAGVPTLSNPIPRS